LNFAQSQSNHGLSTLMACSFILEIIFGFFMYYFVPAVSNFTFDDSYWPATASPFSRLPVFFMGICAGVLCNRIQDGDLNALNSMIF
jgi:hypothetical protein